MDLELEGKVAMVAGGTRGIGRAIVEALLAEGCHVAFCARSQEGVNSALEELFSTGKVMGTALDLMDGAAVQKWVRDVAKSLGGLDIYVHNASAIAQGNSVSDWQKSLTTDVLSPLSALETAIPLLKASAAEKGDAAILAISSISGAISRNPNPYGAIKAALDHYICGLAKELAVDKVRANTISPGTIYFKDGFWGKAEKNNPQYFASMVEQNPMKRMGTPQEVANAVAFLVSPKASLVSGSNMVVDGAMKPSVSF